MAYFHALGQKHVTPEVSPLPLESPSLSHKFMLFGAQAPPRPDDPHLSAKALMALPPSPSIIDCCKLLGNTVRDSATGSVGHQRTSITTLDSCGPDGAWTTPGKLFTPTLHLLISTSLNITDLILRPAVGTFLPPSLGMRDRLVLLQISPSFLLPISESLQHLYWTFWRNYTIVFCSSCRTVSCYCPLM
jgi:hypothetical protein